MSRRDDPARALWNAARIAERRHAKGSFARTANGTACDEGSSMARCFCALGALRVACAKQKGWETSLFSGLHSECVTRLTHEVLSLAGTGRVAKWNDDDATTGADVARVMRGAIGRVGAPRRR